MRGLSTAFLGNGYSGKMWRAQASSGESRWGMESGKDFQAEGRGVWGLGCFGWTAWSSVSLDTDVQCWGVWNAVLGKEALFHQDGFESETRVFYFKGRWGHSEGFLNQGEKMIRHSQGPLPEFTQETKLQIWSILDEQQIRAKELRDLKRHSQPCPRAGAFVLPPCWDILSKEPIRSHKIQSFLIAKSSLLFG